MNNKLAAYLLILGVLVGSVLYLASGGRSGGIRAHRGDKTDARPPTGTRSPQETQAPGPRNAGVREETRPADGSSPPGFLRAELAGLTGRVVESDGRPVAGMSVVLLEFDATYLFDGAAIGAEGPSLELEETVTDGEGRFALGGARASAFHGLGIDLGGSRPTIRVIDESLTQRASTDIGDVVLAAHGVVTGRVIDEHGTPISGARVRIGPFPEEILRVSPQELRPDSLIAITLLAEGGEGLRIVELPEWIHEAVERLPFPSTRSAADGGFRLEGVPLARVVGLVDRHGLVGVSIGPLDLTAGETGLGNVVLRSGRTILGVIEDRYGEPVPGIEVHAGVEVLPGVAAILQPCGRSDEEGRFELAGAPDIGRVVAAARRGAEEPWTSCVASDSERVLIEMESAIQLTVHVQDQQGEPLSGARIQVDPTPPGGSETALDGLLSGLLRSPGKTGTFREVEPGQYVVTGLGAGLYDLTARVPELTPGFQQVDCRAGSRAITLTCARGVRVELLVLDNVSREPVRGARASVLRAAPTGLTKLAVAMTDQDGRVELGPLEDVAPQGTEADLHSIQTMLLVQHPRHVDYSVELDLQTSPLVVRLQSGGSLAGRVSWGGATPSRAYMLTLESIDANGILEVLRLPRLAVTDRAGEFQLGDLAQGTYTLELRARFLDKEPLGTIARGAPPLLHQEFLEIQDGATTRLAIDLSPSGRGETARILGRVRVDGHGLAGAEVEVHGTESLRVVTDAAGRFETVPFSFGNLTWIRIEGDLRSADGMTHRTKLHEQALQLQSGEVREIDLDLYPLRIRVQVLDSVSGDPIPEAVVSARIQGRESDDGGGTTNSAGEVELLILEPADYVLTASATDRGVASSLVSVPATGLFEPIRLRLARTVACAGRVLVDPSLAVQIGFDYLHVERVDNGHALLAPLTAPDNTFTLEGLTEGEYRAWVSISGQRGKTESFVLGAGGRRDLVFAFVPSRD